MYVLKLLKLLLVLIFWVQCSCYEAALIQNKSHHTRRSSAYTVENTGTYRSFQPISLKTKNLIYPRADERPDYDITSYDAEYGGSVVSNFTSSIYDDNPPLYPNPEVLSKNNEVAVKQVENTLPEPEVDLPDDSLADADLAEHNIIDSVTYVYGLTTCHRTQYMIVIFMTCFFASLLLVGTTIFVLWSDHFIDFRRNSRIYPIVLNLCFCLTGCILLFGRGAEGFKSRQQCKMFASIVHYAHITCASWILVLAATVTEFCVYEGVSPLKVIYLLGYGIPAVFVTFDNALSLEEYEFKRYCWMSLEKGMVTGFMVPAMIFIILNTTAVIIGLQSLNRKQTELVATKIQELVNHHIILKPKNEMEEIDGNGSMENIERSSNGHSRKNTDSSDTLDKDYDEDGNYGDDNGETENESSTHSRNSMEKKVMNMAYMENMFMKWTVNTEINELKSYLNLCLILEPFFAINWAMGVVAIENSAHWSTPSIYLILELAMVLYLVITICMNHPIVRNRADDTVSVCEEVVIVPPVAQARSTDSIPLLDPAVSQPNVTPAPNDSISTIST